jgi:hypothetical protein
MKKRVLSIIAGITVATLFFSGTPKPLEAKAIELTYANYFLTPPRYPFSLLRGMAPQRPTLTN